MPPIVLLHGWGGSFASTWAAHGWTDALEAAGRTPVVLDLPGHGGPAAHDPSAYADLAGLLAARLPEGQAIDLIGYSLGAKLALALAARHPHRVNRVVIGGIGDNLFAPEPHGEAVAQALEIGITPHTSPTVAALARYALASKGDPQAMAAVLRRPPNPSLTANHLTDIGPILLVNGAADHIAGSDNRLRAALGRHEYLRLDDVDHLNLPAEPAFRRAALSFLSKVP